MTFKPGLFPAPISPRKVKPPKEKKLRAPLKSSGKPMKKENKPRRAKAFVEDFGGAEYHDYITSLPCDVCGVEGFTVAAHLKSRGAGGKADVLAPLCCTHKAPPPPGKMLAFGVTPTLGCHERYDAHDPEIRSHEPRLRELAKARRSAWVFAMGVAA